MGRISKVKISVGLIVLVCVFAWVSEVSSDGLMSQEVASCLSTEVLIEHCSSEGGWRFPALHRELEARAYISPAVATRILEVSAESCWLREYVGLGLAVDLAFSRKDKAAMAFLKRLQETDIKLESYCSKLNSTLAKRLQ